MDPRHFPEPARLRDRNLCGKRDDGFDLNESAPGVSSIKTYFVPRLKEWQDDGRRRDIEQANRTAACAAARSRSRAACPESKWSRGCRSPSLGTMFAQGWLHVRNLHKTHSLLAGPRVFHHHDRITELPVPRRPIMIAQVPRRVLPSPCRRM